MPTKWWHLLFYSKSNLFLLELKSHVDLKNPESVRNIVIKAIERSAMDVETWKYSRIVQQPFDKLKEMFELDSSELPVFEVQGESKHTLITTRRIIEKTLGSINAVEFEDIDDIMYGLFKGRIDKPELSTFRVVDLYGVQNDFQLETGKAAVGLIKSVNMVRKLIVDR